MDLRWEATLTQLHCPNKSVSDNIGSRIIVRTEPLTYTGSWCNLVIKAGIISITTSVQIHEFLALETAAGG